MSDASIAYVLAAGIEYHLNVATGRWTAAWLSHAGSGTVSAKDLLTGGNLLSVVATEMNREQVAAQIEAAFRGAIDVPWLIMDASELGLRVGEWPDEIGIEGVIYGRAGRVHNPFSGELDYVVYETADRTRTVNVYNT